MKSLIQNYINGNLATARKQAKRYGYRALVIRLDGRAA